MAFKNPFGGRSGRQVLEGANFALYTLIVVAILTLASWFVSRHDHSWDLTPNKKYSLAPQTVKMLKDMNQDVTIYVFDRERSFGQRRDLLNMFSSTSRRLTVRYVDVDRQPALAKQYAVRSYGTVVVAAGPPLRGPERHRGRYQQRFDSVIQGAAHRLLPRRPRGARLGEL